MNYFHHLSGQQKGPRQVRSRLQGLYVCMYVCVVWNKDIINVDMYVCICVYVYMCIGDHRQCGSEAEDIGAQPNLCVVRLSSPVQASRKMEKSR